MNTFSHDGYLRGIELKLGESLVSAGDINLTHLNQPLSSLQAILGLTDVRQPHEIGKNGPAIASRALNADATESAHSEQGKFDVFFPRDAHVVADILRGPQFLPLARATVMASFEQMGVIDNYTHPVGLLDEQEIGKIPHEVRDPDDVIARDLSQRKDWGWPYYGAVDTTGKNILTLTRYIEQSDEGIEFLEQTFRGRDGVERTVGQGLRMNLEWIIGRMQLNPEGLVEMLAKNPKHHANQNWADSPEAFHHADGSWPAHHPQRNWGVAALDVQGETYAALKNAAALYARIGEIERAAELKEKSLVLRDAVLMHFWVDDPQHFGGYFGRGTDRDPLGNVRVLAIRTSDMGLLLDSGLLDDTGNDSLDVELRFKRTAIVNNLLSGEMLCPSGIRTLSSDSVRYSPDRYHNGASWPWTTYYAARGMVRYGFLTEAWAMKARILASHLKTGLLSEYYSGGDDPARLLVDQMVVVEDATLPGEGAYPVAQAAQEQQAWTAATLLAIKTENNPLQTPPPQLEQLYS